MDIGQILVLGVVGVIVLTLAYIVTSVKLAKTRSQTLAAICSSVALAVLAVSFVIICVVMAQQWAAPVLALFVLVIPSLVYVVINKASTAHEEASRKTHVSIPRATGKVVSGAKQKAQDEPELTKPVKPAKEPAQTKKPVTLPKPEKPVASAVKSPLKESVDEPKITPPVVAPVKEPELEAPVINGEPKVTAVDIATQDERDTLAGMSANAVGIGSAIEGAFESAFEETKQSKEPAVLEPEEIFGADVEIEEPQPLAASFTKEPSTSGVETTSFIEDSAVTEEIALEEPAEQTVPSVPEVPAAAVAAVAASSAEFVAGSSVSAAAQETTGASAEAIAETPQAPQYVVESQQAAMPEQPAEPAQPEKKPYAPPAWAIAAKERTAAKAAAAEEAARLAEEEAAAKAAASLEAAVQAAAAAKEATVFDADDYFQRAQALRDKGLFPVAARLYSECAELSSDTNTINKARLEEMVCYIKSNEDEKAEQIAKELLPLVGELSDVDKIKVFSVLKKAS